MSEATANKGSGAVDSSRRTWLITSCAMGGVGAAAVAVPFVSTFQPSERAKAAGAAVEVDVSGIAPGEKVVVEWRGKPAAIRCDNGPEYISEELKQWAQQKRIALRYIQPGNPQQNAYIERFNRTVRYDWLGHYLFESLNELQEFATNWLWVYNHERPNIDWPLEDPDTSPLLT